MSFKSIKNEHFLTYAPQTGRIEGTIGIACNDQARYSKFTTNFARLVQQYPHVKIYTRIGLQITRARNEIMDHIEGDWLWWIDDDHMFQPDILPQLLSRQKDIVGPLYVMRQMPPMTTARVVRTNPEGKKEYGIPNIWSQPPGLIEVDCLGTAGMLVRRKVWEKLDKPYFKVGHVAPDLISEDLYFCEQAKEKGFKIYLDTSLIMGHIASTTLIPKFENGKWWCQMDFPNGHYDVECK